MAQKVYDVVAVTGEYTDRNGTQKKRHLNCGVVFQTDKGLSLKLEAIPVESNGWFMFFEPRNDPQPRQPAPQAAHTDPGFDPSDDVPF